MTQNDRPAPDPSPPTAVLTASERSELYRRHRPAVVDLLARRLGNLEEAEALAQEALLRALDAASKETLRSFVAYALRVANNLAIDALRRRRFDLPGAEPDTLPVEPSQASLVDHGRLRDHVDRLPEDLRQVVILRYLDGMSFADIADRLQMSKNGVFARHERALDLLRETLAPRRSS
ncbi:MAG: sigma-70 family RNA polymerase sigma factor [Alphaproteobacteria bacterium]|nr:sigma-70 family RNA polymerase sigma factor [Alphaproteobacteria bacterium]MCB9695561.1 sigma-70 family RNA polymerase sigma factor [Alphaproteobacteria bacterium]